MASMVFSDAICSIGYPERLNNDLIPFSAIWGIGDSERFWGIGIESF